MKKTIDSNDTTSSETLTQSTEPSYVVVRDGYRVESTEYSSIDDPVAIQTKEFWTKVAKNHSWGEKVEIVQYDVKLHRCW